MMPPDTQKITLPDLDTALQEAMAAVEAATTLDALEALRVETLGRSGKLTLLKRGLKDLSEAERPAFGQRLNEISETLTRRLDETRETLERAAIDEKLSTETLDVTMPGVYAPQGKVHPLTQVTRDICEIFQGMGFTVLDDFLCPEVETEHYNFEALNFPPDHPARDMQDTMYTDVAPQVLLRSHTSNAQIRHIEQHKPPVRIVAPGRVYRNEQVSSRKNVLFHQIEGLLIDEDVRFSDLKGILHEFSRQFFGGERKTRFRASYFPFTEPSAEVDVQCIFCEGAGCRVCNQAGWLEILGCGMVHPNVLEGVGIDSEHYTGFAFGMGIERMTMLRDAVQDIRLFYNGDLRFLRQYRGGL